MPKYDLKTPFEVAKAAKRANDYASRERNQNSYNTAWLYGYAFALKEVAEQQMQHAREQNETKVLREILSLAEAELNDNGSIGYTMPDGKHHIFIYVDDVSDEKHLYIIEPNRVIDGAHEPMGDTAGAEYNNFSDLAVGCLWCIEQFRYDNFPEVFVEKSTSKDLSSDVFLLSEDDDLFVDDVVYAKVEGYLLATDALVNRLKNAAGKILADTALSTAENINFYPVYDLRSGEVHIESTFWYFEDNQDKPFEIQLPLSPAEQKALRTAMENYCVKKYHMTCEDYVNEIRAGEGIGSKVSLDLKIKTALEQTPGADHKSAENQKTMIQER